LAAIDRLSSMRAAAAGKKTLIGQPSRPQINRRRDLKIKATKQHPLVRGRFLNA
jgi:predicted nicotinamide N-methyase